MENIDFFLQECKYADSDNEANDISDFLKDFENNFKYFGYGYIADKDTLVPSVAFSFYSFHIMVILGFGFMIFFALFLFFSSRGELPQR